jgi:hypothetical protein
MPCRVLMATIIEARGAQPGPPCSRWVMSRTTQVYDVLPVRSNAIWLGRLSCSRPLVWATSPAFCSISPGLVHKSVHTVGAAPGHLLGRAPCGLPPDEEMTLFASPHL